MNAIAIAMSSYSRSVVRHVYHGASSRRDRELKYSSQPIAKNQATMTPNQDAQAYDSTVDTPAQQYYCAKASLPP